MRAVHILLALILLASVAVCNQESETNVNTRYTVESVELSQRAESRLSRTLKADLQKLVGDKFNPETVNRLCQRIKKELSGYKVVQRIAKGTKPENIKVVFDVVRNRHAQDLVLPRLAYHSRQNFTFGADADFGNEQHKAYAGILTDNNELLERYSGFRGGYQRVALGRFRAGFIAESYRAQWNPAIETALAHQLADDPESVPGIYRNRFHVRPKVEVEVLPGVSIGAGISLQRFQTQFPAARYESSNAVVTSLRLLRNWDFSSSGHHKLEAGYDLRAATRSLGSDFAYARHSVRAQYSVRVQKEYISAAFTAGLMNGRAPLFDRFVLGNANTLRGYNKYDVAPLGGNRMAHGSLDYRHSWFRVVYDTGTVYSRGGNSKVLHSLAAGLTSGHKRDSFSFLVAFPLREGRAEPLFILGMNFHMRLPPKYAALWLSVMLAFGVSPLVWSQDLKPLWTGSELRVTAPRLRFLSGKPLESIRNGRAVAFDFQLTLNSGANQVARTLDRFVISYDLWEEKFSVTRLPRDGTGRKQIAHLSDEAAQSWCLENVALPTKGVAADQPFTVMLEIRAVDLRDARAILTEPGISLTALIEIFSRPTRSQQPKWNLQHGPVRLNEVKQ